MARADGLEAASTVGMWATRLRCPSEAAYPQLPPVPRARPCRPATRTLVVGYSLIGEVSGGALRLLIFTGARLREILDLRWEHIDLERGLLLLPASKTGRKTIVLVQLKSKIRPPHMIATQQRGARIGEDDGAVFDDIPAIANAQRVEDVLFDDQNRRAERHDRVDHLEHLLDHDRRETQRGFVQHQELGARHKSARDRHHL